MTAPLRTDAFIDGAWTKAEATFTVRNPATGEALAEVADLGPEAAAGAIAAAAAALPAWSAKLAKDRAAILRRWGDLIVANADPLARLITAEGGKPLAEARGEVLYGASFAEWFAEEAKRAYGRVIPTTAPQRRYITIKQPVG
ncbi:MAG: aldehyde dehydrogenase family protein, partial [Alphaproteobacteria bacterium]|nr:aldehyde dehydrogenase family protein [Alphaproteobacteria bacterium]